MKSTNLMLNIVLLNSNIQHKWTIVQEYKNENNQFLILKKDGKTQCQIIL